MRYLYALLAASIISFSAHATIETIHATIETISEWGPEDRVVIGAGCISEDAVMYIAEAAEANEMALRQAFNIVKGMGLCGVFPPREGILKKRIKTFVDFEKDTMEIWQVELDGLDKPFWAWIIAKGEKS